MSSFNLKDNVILIIVFGGLAALLNMFRLPLFFEAEFVFGPFLVLIISFYRGPIAGLLTSVIATIPLVIAWGSFWSTTIFGMEAVFVGLVCSYKRINVILLVMFYWLIIGMPVSWYSISQYEFFLDSHRTSILIKQLTNAIVYAYIASLVIYLPKVRKYLNQSINLSGVSIKQQSSHIITSLLISVGIVFFFFNLNQNIKNASDKFSLEHDNKHNQLSFHLALILDSKVIAIDEFKYVLSKVWDDLESRKQSLLGFNQRHPEFKTMILADSNGQLINSSPPELIENVLSQNEIISVADRDYFKAVINTQESFVSPGFTGRGFGNQLISAVSVGVPSKMNPQINVGIVEGSFILNSLKEIQAIINAISPAVNGILVDQNNQVLIASKNIQLETLKPLELQGGVDEFYDHNLVSIINPDGSKSPEVYFMAESKFDFNWKLITLQNESMFAQVIERTLIAFAVSIVLLVLIAKLLAELISQSWSYSLQRLNQIIEQGSNRNDELPEFEENNRLPIEVNNLYQEIKSSRLKIIKMNHELQNTVAERTEKLQTANARLNIMARQDELTKLDNRRVFTEVMNELWLDCQKNLLPMSMLIIDVDHFKKVNDTYGHPVGDGVLIQTAKELDQFKLSEIKCIARIGGEEFCLLLKGMDHKKTIKLAEEIRVHIENTNFQIGADKNIQLTVSIGLATIDPTKFTPTKLYQLADNALYEAKRSGRNQVKDVLMN